MYNTDMPTRAELPSSGQLLRSTFLAFIAAILLLVTVILPAEYNVDPTGIGRLIGLAQMGEIKSQLADEAEQDRKKDLQGKNESEKPLNSSQNSFGLGRIIAGLFITPAMANSHEKAVKQEEVTLTLNPGQGAEIKLVMVKEAKAQFSWTVEGGIVNYDLHGDGGGKEISYKKERGVKAHEGELVAQFDGKHGWFWRNRGAKPVTITLKVNGAYSEIKRML